MAWVSYLFPTTLLTMSEILIFDVNETLLDLRVLRPHFERTFGSEQVMAEWFGLMLRVTRTYRPFDELGRDALSMTARKYGQSLDEAAIDAVLGDMLRLRAHPDVIPA